MTTSEQFVLTRDRDAWATIRGFVYQVQLTIGRWLALGDDDVLELEHGEDIDLVTQLIAGDPSIQDRLLEQVKHQEGRISLRDPGACAALANFFDHRRNNPTSRLRFRFTTTANLARERSTTMPGRMPAIEAWQRLRAGEFAGEMRANVTAALRAIAQTLVQPIGIPDETWQPFQHWVVSADDDEFMSFVESFEWALASPDVPSSHDEILAELIRQGAADDLAGAEAQYRRLFECVFMCLTRRGTKQLTRQGLVAELVKPAAPVSAIETRLRTLHDALTNRVDLLEQGMEQLAGTVAAAAAEIQALAKARGVETFLNPALIAAPALSEPPPLPRGSMRTATVQALVPSDTSPPVVIGIYGALASGKTQLARLVSHRLGDRRFWIRLRGLSVEAAAVHLVAAIDAILVNANDLTRHKSDWGVRCHAAAKHADVFVLDDLPVFREGDQLGIRLVPLLLASLTEGTSLVLTATHPMGRLQSAVPKAKLHLQSIPSLTEDEVKDVMHAYEASQGVLSSGAPNLICTLTAGHPVLVQRVAQYLQARAWQIDDVVLRELLGRSYANPVNRETTQALLADVTDPGARDLLFRLTTTIDDFSSEAVDALAAVQPNIARRNERFVALLGPWIEEPEPDKFRLSPLVRSLGEQDLDETTRRGCHNALAMRVVAKRVLGPVDVIHAFRHFTGAALHDNAALILLQAFAGLHAAPKPVITQPLAGLILNLPVHEDTGLALKLQVLAYQTVLAHRRKEDARGKAATLLSMLDADTTLPAWAKFGPAVTVAANFALDDPATASGFMRHALMEWDALPSELRESIPVPGGGSLSVDTIAWLCAAGIKNGGHLEEWAKNMRLLPVSIRTRAGANWMAPQVSNLLANRVLTWQYKQPTAERDWEAAASTLEGLAEAGRALDAHSLMVQSQAAQLTALLERGDSLDTIADRAENIIAENATDGDVEFLVCKSVGLALADAGRPDEGMAWLRRAESAAGTTHGLQRVHVSLWLAKFLEADPTGAVPYAERAVERARSLETAPDAPAFDIESVKRSHRSLLVPQAYGELALVKWRAGDRAGAAKAWLTVVERLLTERDDNDETWRAFMVTAGHVSGYLVSVLTTGAAPQEIPGGAEYTVPKPGMLLDPNIGAATLFDDRKLSLLGVHAMQIAEGLGDAPATRRWAEQSAIALRREGLWGAAIVPLRTLVRLAIERADYEQAIEYAFDMATAFWVSRGESTAPDIFKTQPAPRAALGKRAGQAWKGVDPIVASVALLPAFLAVAAASLESADEGHRFATALFVECRRQVDESPESEVWDAALRVVDMTFVAPAGFDALNTLAETLRDKDDLKAVAVMAYLGATLGRTVAPADALRLHLQVGMFVTSQLSAHEALYADTALRFFELFWWAVFERARFRFSAPDLVRSQLDELTGLPVVRRLQRLLDIVASGLSIRLPPHIQQWLRTEPA